MSGYRWKIGSNTSDEPEPKQRTWRTGPAPSLPDRKPLTIHLAGEMMEALREAARKQGVGIGEYARRLIGKGLKGE